MELEKIVQDKLMDMSKQRHAGVWNNCSHEQVVVRLKVCVYTSMSFHLFLHHFYYALATKWGRAYSVTLVRMYKHTYIHMYVHPSHFLVLLLSRRLRLQGLKLATQFIYVLDRCIKETEFRFKSLQNYVPLIDN